MSLPIINEDDFYYQLRRRAFTSHFSVLLLSIILIAHLSSKRVVGGGKPKLLRTLKSVYSVLQSAGKFSLELVQAVLLIASYEHCQALSQDAWLSIGSCARMGNI